MCKGCGCRTDRGSAFHKLCIGCNTKRLNLNKTPKNNEYAPVKKPKDFTCKECGCQTSQGSKFHKLCIKCNTARLKAKAKPIKRKVYRKKPTGEREMFIKIWSERPHICTNESCGKVLDENPKVHYFAHIKPKGKYPELRLQPSNIKLLCMECHRTLDFGGL